MQKVKQFLNWVNFLGGMRDPECFFETADPLVTASVVGMFNPDF